LGRRRRRSGLSSSASLSFGIEYGADLSHAASVDFDSIRDVITHGGPEVAARVAPRAIRNRKSAHGRVAIVRFIVEFLPESIDHFCSPPEVSARGQLVAFSSRDFELVGGFVITGLVVLVWWGLMGEPQTLRNEPQT